MYYGIGLEDVPKREVSMMAPVQGEPGGEHISMPSISKLPLRIGQEFM